MTIAIVITIYKDIEALNIIIKAIKNQTVLPDEIVIAEDNNAEDVKDFVKNINISGVSVKHTFQEDNGWQRNKSTNNALKVVESDYIIFIDGDCMPHSKLVESHKSLAKDRTALCGRRVYVGPKFSTVLRQEVISSLEFEKKYISNIFNVAKDTRHYEEGLYVNPKGIIYNVLERFRKPKAWVIGCHWSAWKRDLLAINGFDEDFTMPLYGEDVDVERRLRGIGIDFETCRNVAIVYHLHHDKIFDIESYEKPLELMNSKAEDFICKNGLEKL